MDKKYWARYYGKYLNSNNQPSSFAQYCSLSSDESVQVIFVASADTLFVTFVREAKLI